MTSTLRIILLMLAIPSLAGAFASCSDDSGGDPGTDQSADTTGSDADVTGTDTEGGGSGQPVLNEVVADAPAGAPDWVEITNIGDGDADLQGWKLSDRNPDHTVGFSDVGIPSVSSGGFAMLELPAASTWGFGSSDCVVLIDPSGAVRDETCWDTGAADNGRSWGRLPDGSGSWATLAPTPAAPNAGLATCGNGIVDAGEECDGDAFVGVSCLTFSFQSGNLGCRSCAAVLVDGCVPYASDLVINEVSSTEDKIEVMNVGTGDLALDGYSLSDRFDAVDRDHVLPAGVTLGAGERHVIALDLLSAFQIGYAETLVLKDPNRLVVDVASWGGGEAQPSFCRIPDGTGDFAACSASTFDAVNAP